MSKSVVRSALVLALLVTAIGIGAQPAGAAPQPYTITIRAHDGTLLPAGTATAVVCPAGPTCPDDVRQVFSVPANGELVAQVDPDHPGGYGVTVSAYQHFYRTTGLPRGSGFAWNVPDIGQPRSLEVSVMVDGASVAAGQGGGFACPIVEVPEGCVSPAAPSGVPGLFAHTQADGIVRLTLNSAAKYNIRGVHLPTGAPPVVADFIAYNPGSIPISELFQFTTVGTTFSGTVTRTGYDVFPQNTAGVGACEQGFPYPNACRLHVAYANADGSYSLRLPPGTWNVSGFIFIDGAPVIGPAQQVVVPEGGGDPVVMDVNADLNAAGSSTTVGELELTTDGANLLNVAAVPSDSVHTEIPDGVVMPYGVLSFTSPVEVGGTASFTVAFPEPLPEGAAWYKLDDDGAWTVYPSTISVDRSTMTVLITDGAYGDDDGTVNGYVTDPGIPGIATAATNEPPVVTIEAPSSSLRGETEVVASVSDPDDGVAAVDVLVDDALVGQASTSNGSTWTFALDPGVVADDQPHEVTVVATDASGATGQDSVTVPFMREVPVPPVQGAQCWTDPLGDVFDSGAGGLTAVDGIDLAAYCFAVTGGEASFYSRVPSPSDPSQWDIDRYVDFQIDADHNGSTDTFVSFYGNGFQILADSNDPQTGRLCDGVGTVTDGWYRAGGFDLECLGLSSYDFDLRVISTDASGPSFLQDSTAEVEFPAPTAPPVADFDGDGTTDESVWRPEYGGWWVLGQDTVYLGLAGDIAVPADYDGDGTTERAVWRPDTGAWFIEGMPTEYLGVSSDIPVPADYDGDGTAERAVFRPSTGAWYVEGMTTQFFGVDSDIPVPADYDGNGTADLAVYRPSVGGWYIDGQATVFHGLDGDIPVPADYDGNGTADLAVWRPSVGGWYIDGQATEYVGLSTDIPQPGDYNADGTADRAVWRPDVGGWYVQDQPTVYHGLSTDISLVLPHAIQQAITPA